MLSDQVDRKKQQKNLSTLCKMLFIKKPFYTLIFAIISVI